MAIFRVPILIWQNYNGSFTAQAVTGDEYFPPAAFAEKRDAAISEVKEYLQWQFEDEFWREADELEELKLTEFRVEIRPEYKVKPSEESKKKQKKRGREPKQRTFTSEELVPLRVACVH